MAVWTAAVLLARATTKARTHAVLAGLALASAFGMSVWITLAAVPVLAAWQLWLLLRGRQHATAFVFAGVVALLVAMPQLRDLAVNRAQDGFPLALSVRAFATSGAPTDLRSALLLVAMLPVGYLIEFGAFALGARMYLFTKRPRNGDRHPPIAMLLILSAAIGLIEAGFVRSTIINNDFGWRAIWFAQWPAMIWTGVYLAQVAVVPLAMRALLALGVLANAWDMVGLRLIRPPVFATMWGQINATPAIDHAERRAYAWANAHLPADAVMQANPVAAKRVFDFGLYGHFRTAVADSEANLFGASKAEVGERLRRLRPLFERSLPASQVATIARRERIDAIVFSERDPMWRLTNRLRCAYRNERVCIVRIAR